MKSTSKRKDCFRVVFVGDIFHKFDPAGVCRNAVLREFLEFQSYEHIRYPAMYTCIGNHDIANSDDNLPNSALGCLLDVGALVRGDCEHEIAIQFTHWESGIEDRMRNTDLLTASKALIHVAHAYILTKPAPFNHVLFSELPLNPECKLVIAGHYHSPMDETRSDGVRFINPGSICRFEFNEENMTRQPQVVVVDYFPDGSYMDISYVPLECSKPGAEIFSVEEATAVREADKSTKRYVQQMTTLGSFTTGEDKLASLIRRAKEKLVREPVINCVTDCYTAVVVEQQAKRKGVSE